MGKNRNPFYKVYVGDEMRLLKQLSTDAYGLYGIFRNWVHDAEPYAHLVDAHGVPLTNEALIDMSGLRASTFRSAFQDLCVLKAVQRSADWFVQVKAAEHAKYVEVASELVAGVRRMAIVNGDGIADSRTAEALLIPALADQFVRMQFGKKTGGNRKSRDVTPHVTGDVRSFPTSDLHAHSHESENDRDHAFESRLPVLTPGPKERETSTTRARVRGEELPMTQRAYTARCHEISVWQERLGAVSEERFEADFLAKFHMTWAYWCSIREQMEAAIPVPCRDGHHVFEDGSSQCVYCPHLRTENA